MSSIHNDLEEEGAALCLNGLEDVALLVGQSGVRCGWPAFHLDLLPVLQAQCELLRLLGDCCARLIFFKHMWASF